jgi:hypothetical protein
MANALLDLVLFVSDRLRIVLMAMLAVAMMKTAFVLAEPAAPAKTFPVAKVTVEATPSL